LEEWIRYYGVTRYPTFKKVLLFPAQTSQFSFPHTQITRIPRNHTQRELDEHEVTAQAHNQKQMLKFITSWGERKHKQQRASPPSVASDVEDSGDASNDQQTVQPMDLNEQPQQDVQQQHEEEKENGGVAGDDCEGEGHLTDDIKQAQKEAEEALEALEQQGEDEALDVTKVPALLKLADMAHAVREHALLFFFLLCG
jgi:hypothetical protein